MRSIRHSLLPFALLAALLAGPAARADGVRFEVTPFGGYRFGGDFDYVDPETEELKSADLESGGSWGIDLGLYRDQTSFYELLYSTQEISFDSGDAELDGVDVSTEYYHVGGTAFFPAEQWLVPYLSFTVGATEFSAEGFDSDTKFSMSLGGGLRLPFTDNFGATVGVRGYLTFVDSDSDFFCAGGGGEAACLVRSSGSTFFQGEATLGLTLRF
jgi:opacity protein-like surface antigen